MQALSYWKKFSIFRILNVLFLFFSFFFLLLLLVIAKYTLSYQDQTELWDWNISYFYKICLREVESFQVMDW